MFSTTTSPRLSNRWLAPILVVALITTLAIAAPAQTFTSLAEFNSTNGANPYYNGLVQARDGNFYGTTEEDGANFGGTVFRMTTSGTVTTLYNFCSQPSCTDGVFPGAGLVLGTDGNLYGTTVEGGTSNFGTFFKITTAGKL